MRAGEISAMYIGDVRDAAPTPKPPMNRKIMNSVRFLGSAVPRAETRKSTAEIIKTFFLPIRSLMVPAKAAPKTQPTSAQDATQPTPFGSSSKRASSGPIAPDITPVSYPNKSPPNAATIQTIKT
jgi:hypothetical protein